MPNPLIAPQGNINHLDFDSSGKQTGYPEAERIGRRYAGIVLSLLGKVEKVEADGVWARLRTVTVGAREVEEIELKRAEYSASRPLPAAGGDLTACGLAEGNPAVERELARELLFFRSEGRERYEVPLQVLGIGPFRICAIPGEPFAEVGTWLRKALPRHAIFPVALANGYFGYLPLERSFEGGGYEVRAGRLNCLERGAAGIILDELKRMLDPPTGPGRA